MERIWTKHKRISTALKPKVFIGLSGGVDSSVSAALLKKAGYDVTGVFIKVWQPDFINPSTGSGQLQVCNWKEDRLDAMRVCARLEVPFVTLDLEKEYKKEVVDYMVSEYKAGKTPNPDVMCNKHVKFGGFFNWAMKNGADYMAAGHYARIARTALREILNPKSQTINKFQISNSKKQTGCRLLAGADKSKDQSYFLWTLTQRELAKILFPVGDLIKKTEVRNLAKKFGLPTAEKKDSQGLCFMGKIDLKNFLRQYLPLQKGDVLNEKGERIGFHDGAQFLTIGERHGFNIIKKTSEDLPHYVIAKDLKKNTITVSHKTPDGVLSSARKEILITKVNWIAGKNPDCGKKYQARIRYRQPLENCRLEKKGDGKWLVIFDNPQNSAASGQSLVLYDNDECIGGGVIL